MTFKEWKKNLLERAAKFDRPKKARRTVPEITWVNGSVQVAHVNRELLLWCHCCGEGANMATLGPPVLLAWIDEHHLRHL